jgi:hypothetical protein
MGWTGRGVVQYLLPLKDFFIGDPSMDRSKWIDAASMAAGLTAAVFLIAQIIQMVARIGKF